MKILPKKKTERDELNLRLGIKSSLPNIKEFLGTYLSFYLVSDDADSLDYSNANGTSITVKEDTLEKLNSFFQEQLEFSGMESMEGIINNSSLFKSQMEALKVALELYWKLGKINFKDAFPDSKERSGGNRYPKVIHFSTNANILKNIFSDDNGEIYKGSKDILFNWIASGTLEIKDTLEKKILETLSIFSEETQVKIEFNNEDIIFQQESIYKGIVEGNSVDSTGDKELKGPFRIMKKFITSSLHPYIQDNSSEFKLKDSVSIDSLNKYKNKVSTYLDLLTRRTIIENDISEVVAIEETNTSEESKVTSNTIYFGSPGTGKSYAVNEITKEHNVRKVTFHPEYDYHSFVGGYKPTMVENKITYMFVPQIFTKIYMEAWKNLGKHYYLQIEEINRGNCAEIFGDLFQLLDRGSDGSSEYGVHIDEEMAKYLREDTQLVECGGIIDGEIKLPPNLSIIATMNTSDQSLFPMDSAFKRRWDWEYVKIEYDKNKTESDFKIELKNGSTYEWLEFLKGVNEMIFETTGSPDKQIGNWFIDARDNGKIIDEKTFINKVLFYLWNDVFKDEYESIFNIGGETRTYEDFFTKNEHSSLIIQMITENLGLTNPIVEKVEGTESSDSE